MRKIRLAVAWVATAYLAWLIVPMGLVKFDPDGFWTSAFERWGYPGWLRLAVGVLEAGGGILLLVPRTSAYAAVALVMVMTGAAITRFGDDRMADVLWILAYSVALSWIALEYWPLRWRFRRAAPKR